MKKPLPTRDFGLQKWILTKELERRIDIAVKFGRWLHVVHKRMEKAYVSLCDCNPVTLQWDENESGVYLFRRSENMWCECFALALYLHSRIEELKK